MPMPHQLVTIPSTATWSPALTQAPNPLMIPGPHRKLLFARSIPSVSLSMLVPMTAKPLIETTAFGGKVKQVPVLALVVMLLTRSNRVSVGLETLKSPHADTSTAQAGALTPITSPSTSRLPSTTARPAWFRLRIACLLALTLPPPVHRHWPPRCGAATPHPPFWPIVPPASHGQRMGTNRSRGRERVSRKMLPPPGLLTRRVAGRRRLP